MRSTALFALLLAGLRSTQARKMVPGGRQGPIEVEGTFRHASGMDFPEDVGVAYRDTRVDIPIVLTVFAYPAPSVVSIGSPAAVVEEARENLFASVSRASVDEVLGGTRERESCDKGRSGLRSRTRGGPGTRRSLLSTWPSLGSRSRWSR
jgi:hypothetical protein